MFARFDQNPAMTLQDIKETKRYGRTHAHTDGQHENSIHGKVKFDSLCIYEMFIFLYNCLSRNHNTFEKCLTFYIS